MSEQRPERPESPVQVSVQRTVSARIPTPDGEFFLYHFRSPWENKEHLALVMGDVQGDQVLVRVHSECFTGDVLGSRRCDCGEQLALAMHAIAREGRGVIVYLRQEGRGIGLEDKLRAYNLQDEGYDTVDANLLLGHQADERDYTAAALILQDLGVRSVRLLTNNPAKVEGLTTLGIPVHARAPLQAPHHQENLAYLQTKASRMRHLLNLNGHHPTLPTAEPYAMLVKTLRARIRAHQAQEQRPFVTLSFAQSLDGCLTLHQGTPTALSGPESLAMTHHLRAEHQGILVGVGTVLADDPSLTVRLVEGPNPQRVVVDSHLQLPLGAKLLQGDPVWIATTENAPSARRQPLEKAGARVLPLPATAGGQVDLSALLHVLAQKGLTSLMVEGGARILSSFLSQKLADFLITTIAPVFLGGYHSFQPGNGAAQAPTPAPRLQQVESLQLGQDIVLWGELA